MKPSCGLVLLSPLLVAALLSPAFAATPGIVLEDGTPVKLRISRTVSSADAHAGDTVDFEVLEEIKVGNLLVVPKGGTAWGTVTEAESKKRMARGGKLNMNIDSVRLLDGEKVALRAVKEVKGGGHTGAMTGGIVATAIVFWPAAPFFLFMHGKDITVPKGTEITAYINGNSPIDVAKFQTAGEPPAAALASAAPKLETSTLPTESATLDVTSTPPDADIEIDGSFAGNTPSSVGIAPGDHTVRITKKGFSPWEKKIHSSTGNVRMTAELEPNAIPTSTPANSPATAPVVVTQQTPGAKVAPTVASQPVTAPSPMVPTSNPSQVTVSEPQLRPAVLKSTESAAAPFNSKSAPVANPQTSGENAAFTSDAQGMTSITSDPDKAEIFVDSVGQGRTPALLKLKSGKHKVQLVADGFKDWVGEVDVKAGTTVNVTGKLER